MRKILILANNDVGLYKFRKLLIETLIAEGNEIYISLPKGEYIKNLEEIGCKYIESQIDRRGMNPIKDMKYFFQCKKIIKRVKPDLVLSYTIKPNIYGCLAARITKKPHYANITGLGTSFQNNGILKKIVVYFYKVALKKAGCVFFENQGNLNIFVEEGILPKERCVALNGAGVDLEQYQFSELPKEYDTTNFLFVGRVMKEKGVEELFHVAQKCKENSLPVSFTIIGGMEENYKDKLESLTSNGIINYCGFQKDVQSFIKEAHCTVLPSYHEGMSNTLLEAAAMGRPLITSNIHGCKEAVIDKKSGFLCKVKDAESLYECVISFLNLSYEEKQEMGKASREIMESRFDKKIVVEKTLKEIF